MCCIVMKLYLVKTNKQSRSQWFDVISCRKGVIKMHIQRRRVISIRAELTMKLLISSLLLATLAYGHILPDTDSSGDTWAVLIAGSDGYFNYRHQADVCHAFQVSSTYVQNNIGGKSQCFFKYFLRFKKVGMLYHNLR